MVYSYVVLAFILVAAAFATWFLWPQIVKVLVAWGLSAAWDALKIGIGAVLAALKADRMDPETEARWRDCQRRGGRWDARRKRCVEPH